MLTKRNPEFPALRTAHFPPGEVLNACSGAIFVSSWNQTNGRMREQDSSGRLLGFVSCSLNCYLAPLGFHWPTFHSGNPRPSPELPQLRSLLAGSLHSELQLIVYLWCSVTFLTSSHSGWTSRRNQEESFTPGVGGAAQRTVKHRQDSAPSLQELSVSASLQSSLRLWKDTDLSVCSMEHSG